MMDGYFGHDLDEAIRSIGCAEVLSVFFPTFRKALVIDYRSNDAEGPMARIMPMAASPQERLRSIRRLRPGFPRLDSLALVPWPRYVESLVELGAWERIVQRFRASGRDEAVRTCERLLEELRRLEKAELAAAVLGENHQTIWSARE